MATVSAPPPSLALTTRSLGDVLVHISAPASYKTHGSASFYALFVFGDLALFRSVAAEARALHHTHSAQPGRNWYPDLLVVGVSHKYDRPLTLDMVRAAVGLADGEYRTNPYAAGRALLGRLSATTTTAAAATTTATEGSSVASALARGHPISQLFAYVLCGTNTTTTAATRGQEAASGGGGRSGGGGVVPPALLAPGGVAAKEGGVYLYCSEPKDGDTAAAAALESLHGLRAALETAAQTSGSANDKTVVQVDRHGVQRQQEVDLQAALPTVTLDVGGGGGGGEAEAGEAFARRAVDWVSVRLERRKLDSLARQYAWSEFR